MQPPLTIEMQKKWERSSAKTLNVCVPLCVVKLVIPLCVVIHRFAHTVAVAAAVVLLHNHRSWQLWSERWCLPM